MINSNIIISKAPATLALLFYVIFSISSTYANENINFDITEVASGLDTPWGMTFISDDTILFTEKYGNIKLLSLKTNAIRIIGNVAHLKVSGQGGLMDVQTSPNFDKTGWLYFTYTKKFGSQSATTLARAKLDEENLTHWENLFTSNYPSSSGRHFGSRIAFDNTNHVFITHGDRGDRKNAQLLENHAGTIIRLNIDGSIPSDNPFVNTVNAMPEIWSYGHRNPQGIVYDNQHNRLWAIEHGPRGGDELNLIHAAHNYGWPIISYGKEYMLPVQVGEGTHKSGMEQPTTYYVPSIAPGSLMLYSGKSFKHWRGNLFAGSLKLTHLNRIVLDESGRFVAEHRLLTDLNERFRHVIESPKGWIYLSTDSGRILQLSPQ